LSGRFLGVVAVALASQNFVSSSCLHIVAPATPTLCCGRAVVYVEQQRAMLASCFKQVIFRLEASGAAKSSIFITHATSADEKSRGVSIVSRINDKVEQIEAWR
jgi:hypothetical protein